MAVLKVCTEILEAKNVFSTGNPNLGLNMPFRGTAFLNDNQCTLMAVCEQGMETPCFGDVHGPGTMQ
jgi:hypothetical protein